MKQTELQALLADMSLEEKIGQMVQLTGDFLGQEGIVTGPEGRIVVTPEQARLTGSILGVSGADKLRAIQEQVLAGQPHHIPMLFMLDVINGFKTIFPIPLAQGASFEPELAKRGAQIAAAEASAAGVHLTFAPMLDLVRDARWGRVMESPGEDPFLVGAFAEAMTKGFQGDKLSDKGKMAACLKHFAGYGYPEGGRDYDNVELSERTFRDAFLPGYRKAVEAGVAMAMTSFNTINRVPSSANRWLMRDVLRGEMGFDGVLISDYDAVGELVSHGIAADDREAAKLAILAGVDIDMMSPCYLNHLQELVESGEVEERLIDEAVMRILKLKNDLGLFENPFKDADEAEASRLILCDPFRREAREAAAKTFVLLKNEDAILPLSAAADETVLLSGPYCTERRICGAWSFPDTYDNIPNVLERVAEGLSGSALKAEYAPGCSVTLRGSILKDKPEEGMTHEETEKVIREAAEKAAGAGKVILFLGERFYQTGEGSSRTELSLPGMQMDLLRAVSSVNPNVITVVFSGRPLVMTEIEQLSKAVLMVWMPGTEGAGAIADVLLGKREPEGRLSMSLPFAAGQEPLYYNRFRSGRPRFSSEDIKGYKVGYIDIDYWPHHPFGYGLGYTEFTCSPVKLSADTLEAGGSITASVTVKNTGKRPGSETVQLYLRDAAGSVVRPVRELKGFTKVRLQPGECREVAFTITEEMLRFTRLDMRFASEPGDFEVFIGHDSLTENKAVFRLQA